MDRCHRRPLAAAAAFWPRWQAFVLAGFAVLLMSVVLFSGGGIGLSNNGDFGRVMGTNSLEFADEPELFVYEDTYRMEFRGTRRGRSCGICCFPRKRSRPTPPSTWFSSGRRWWATWRSTC